MQATLIASTGTEKSWTLPKALLSHHSGYFQRTRRFMENERVQVTLESFEPEIFKLFVQFIYFGRYSYRDDLSDHTRIRDSAKAWVLGDYLDAVYLKNFAMHNLHEIYFPSNDQMPKSTVGPEAIDNCCAMTPTNSKLYNFFNDVLVVYWHSLDVINYTNANRGFWEEIWDEHPELRNDLLYYTNQSEVGRKQKRCDVEDYLEELKITEEPVVEHS